MKQISFILAIVFAFHCQESISQNLIAVQNGGTSAFFQQVDSAIIHSQDGDTIFIPGGTWNITKPINKRLHIIGVGHNPDSTNATFPTTLNGLLIMTTGASLGSLTGVLLGHLYGPNGSVSSYTVSRCRISNGITTSASQSNFVFIENIIIGYINGGYGSAINCSFFNNIISAEFSSGAISPYINSTFKNNIFLFNSNCSYGCQYAIASQYSLFENNVFLLNTLFSQAVLNSTAKNNLFFENISFPVGTNVGSNNIVNQSSGSIFINMGSPANTFSYNNDYHLQSTCPGKNAGTDGTDVGIYGGIYPWKAGSITFNPHFQTVNVSPTTNPSGNLPVNIKVSAQDH